MGDGSYKQGGLILCTDSFSNPDVVLLINVLIVKYQLESSLQMYDGLPRIYIKRSGPRRGAPPHGVGELNAIITNNCFTTYA
jgi:hypothetical protein